MTLATETIKLWRNNAKITAGETAEDDPEHIAAKAILALTAEILANRETQPVALVDRRPAASGGIYWQHGGKDLPHGTELYTAPPAPAVPDEIDSFADQVIGTKDKIIRLPAPLGVPHESINVYLNADALLKCIEQQGIIVLLDYI
ncbi:hypothetical protein PTR49_15240 [Serratia ureilytica]|uniref:hypothetical protein n=1 Tax=Serratia ureilytica TaxID=300181 RepID=UPI00313DE83E